MSESTQNRCHLNLIKRIGITVATHPFHYVDILYGLGYERPYVVKQWNGTTRKCNRQPVGNTFKYLAYIIEGYGYCEIFRGLTCSLADTLIYEFARIKAVNWQLRCHDKQTVTTREEPLKNFFCSLLHKTGTHFVALLASYPFRLMSIRVCAQFIDKENDLAFDDSLLSVARDIYQTKGFSGFYSGFIPQLLADCLVIFIGSSIVFAINWFDIESYLPNKLYAQNSLSLALSWAVYPLNLVSTIMCCNGSTATSSYIDPESKVFSNWIDCWRYTQRRGQLNRGASLLLKRTSFEHLVVNKGKIFDN